MANEEVLGPRKTMFVLVIVVGCFAVLWPRILSPLLVGSSREQLKPNKFDRDAALKQERPAIRGVGPHPALRERGRAIPAGAPPPPTRGPVTMPPHARVRSSPLSVYFELDIKPPPIPGMRPPLGSPGGPVPAPKSSMGFVMPIYTICIIVFFVYTLSKILFRRTGTSSYEPLTPDPQFRRRVFRDDSRTSPDKLGPKERDTIVTAISGLVAEVQQQMEASYALNQQRQDVQQDNQTRPYTNGTILHNSGPVHIVASEYHEQNKEKTPEPALKKEVTPELEIEKTVTEDAEARKKASSPELEVSDTKVETLNETIVEKESIPEPDSNVKSTTPDLEKDLKDSTPALDKDVKVGTPEPKETNPETTADVEEDEEEEEEEEIEDEDLGYIDLNEFKAASELIERAQARAFNKSANDVKVEKNGDILRTDDFREETKSVIEEKKEKQSTPELLEEAIKDEDDEDENEKSSVKVVGMEVTAHLADGGTCRATPLAANVAPPRAHEAESVQSIYLDTDIPQQSRVLVAEFAEDRANKPQPTNHSPMVVSGKMTLSLIQDAPRDTPERDQESTVDEFTTASAVTQNAPEKQGEASDEEIEEEIEIEEIEEEVEEIEEEEEEEDEPEKKQKEPIKKTE